MNKLTHLLAILAVTLLMLISTNPCHAEEVKIQVDFRAADTDSDGKLSKEELGRHLTSSIINQLVQKIGKDQAEQLAKQIVPEVVESLFNKGDANQDGFLTEEELKKSAG